MKQLLLIPLLFVALSACTLFGTWEEPKYNVRLKDGDYELREYDSYIIAEVEIANKSYDEAISEGFNILADYIFGNNQSQTKIQMTTPVTVGKSEEISMTAPVRVDRDLKNNIWYMSFSIPSKWTMATVPLPNDNRITLKEMPPELVIAVTFSWFMNEEKIREYEIKLNEWARRNKFEIITPVKTAIYDPPMWTLPFLRRNEVLLGVM